MYCETHAVTIETDDAGAGAGYTPAVTGRVLAIRYVKPAEDAYAAGVDVSVTNETNGAAVWVEDDVDASATRCPRQPTHNTAGVAALFAAAGQPVNDYCWLARERLKIEIADGGVEKTGTFYVTIG